MKVSAPFACLVFIAFASAQSMQKNSFLDDILKNVLESLREIAKDAAIPDSAFNITIKEANVTGTITGGRMENLNNFVIQKLTTSLLPLKLTNLTLTLDHLVVTGNYSLNGLVDLPSFAGPFAIFGEGPFQIDLYGIFFTIAADFKLQDFVVQITPDGLKGFDFFIMRSEINFENLMGGGEKENAINKYFSLYLPEFVNDYKFVFFNSVRKTLIQVINDILAGKNFFLENKASNFSDE